MSVLSSVKQTAVVCFATCLINCYGCHRKLCAESWNVFTLFHYPNLCRDGRGIHLCIPCELTATSEYSQ